MMRAAAVPGWSSRNQNQNHYACALALALALAHALAACQGLDLRGVSCVGKCGETREAPRSHSTPTRAQAPWTCRRQLDSASADAPSLPLLELC